MKEAVKEKKIISINQRKRNRIIFYTCLITLPLLQFAIFYVYVNINSIILAFQKYVVNKETNRGAYEWYGFGNFKNVFYKFAHEEILPQAFKNTLICFAITILVGFGGALMFSFYITKKMPFSKTFRFTLFLPSMISAVVLILIFRYFSENALLNLVNQCRPKDAQPLSGLIYGTSNVAFWMVLSYTIFTGFGTMILMFSGAMSDVDESLVEAAALDGATQIQEFFHVYLPLIYPTLVTFLVVNLSGLFTNQMGLFSFFGGQADPQLYTIGYYMFKEVLASDGGMSLPAFCELSAMGVTFTLIAVPVVFGSKVLLEKIGPKVD